MINQSQNSNETQEQDINDWSPESVPQLTVDMYRKDNVIYVVSTVAGVAENDLDISVENNTLFIKGLRKAPYNQEEVQVDLAECFWGEFYREIPLSDTVNVDEVEGTLTGGGILTIKIPVLMLTSKKISVKKLM
jgi:HSP20 family protein